MSEGLFMSPLSVQKGIEYDGLSTEFTAIVGFVELKFFKTLNVSS